MQETCKKGHVQVLQIVKHIPHSTEIDTPKKQTLNGKWAMLDEVAWNGVGGWMNRGHLALLLGLFFRVPCFFL
jgi:hypothetical protein